MEVLHLIIFSRLAKVGEYCVDDSLDLELIVPRSLDNNGLFITCRNISICLLGLLQFIIISVIRSYLDLFLDQNILLPLLLVFSLEDEIDRFSYLYLSTFCLYSILSNTLLLTSASSLLILNPIPGHEYDIISIYTEDLLWWIFLKT